LLALSKFEVTPVQTQLGFETFADETEVLGLWAQQQAKIGFQVIHQCRFAHTRRADDKGVFSLRVELLEPRDFPFSTDKRKQELANFV
jgi:hypothetical protein